MGKVYTGDTVTIACLRCRRTLSDAQSVQIGLGPICRSKAKGEAMRGSDEAERGTVADLPFDPKTMDIVCRRDADWRPGYGLHFNISQRIVEHSADGFEFGYRGSGPADFALNILALFIGEQRARRAGLYHAFKDQFVATLPREGGVIHGDTIREWIAWHEARFIWGADDENGNNEEA